ncbi:hypothetical protein QTP70_013847 [Hemibagrus guttatus]|uniref:Uncharacterized protein n=1 Tax=Hemibagrus guttatus TaxID=175788 RepID=A0AAE0RE65_9TELE|nr:hypothetical protein QTP70_013847 [Hemibagrus guttatus]
MESRHHPVKWKRICVPCIFFVLAILRQCDATEEQNIFNNTVTCQENEYLHTGFCCDKCPPAKEIEIQPCTHKQNRICGCETGYYKNVVNEITMSCDPCRKCGEGERDIRPCEGEKNTVCDCKYNHFRVAKGICAPCTNCSSKCPEICRSTDITTPPGLPLPTAFILCLSVVIGLVCCISVHLGVKYWKRIQTQYSQSHMACDPEKQVGKSETPICTQEVERILLPSQPETVLPDCIPREIKTHEFIYSVLDIVPVSRFKELVRRLNVSEQDIDRAERDHRAFADAQYQMLMVWVESGTRGGKSVLPCPLFQECVNTLKDMNLTACAESIEDKYNTSSFYN